MIIKIPKYFTKDDFKISGIYFLLRRNKIVYIGRTINLINRIYQHSEKNFDSIRIIKCNIDRLEHYEIRLIRYFQPKYNQMYTDRWAFIGSNKSKAHYKIKTTYLA